MKKTLLAALLTTLATLLWANGGPVDWSTVTSTGDARLINVASVLLHKEKLSFCIKAEYIKVDVEYTLERTGWDELTTEVQYGFPIDFGHYLDYEEGYRWDERNIKDLKFVANGKELSYKSQEDLSIYTKRINFVDEYGSYHEEERDIKRKWFYTTFDLKKGEVVTLRVSYLIMPSFEDSATSKSFFTYYGERGLYWDFTPAGYWGEGAATEFEVYLTIDKDAVDEGSLRISGLPMVLKDGVYSYKASNFILKNAEPLSLFYMQNRILGDLEIKNSNILQGDNLISVKTSSAKQGYPAKNLTDNNLSTTWCPEGNGVGEWIEIETKPFILGSIVLVGGYTKSEETNNNNNNRIKTIRVQLATDEYDYNDTTLKENIDERYVPTFELEDIPFAQPVRLSPYIIYDTEGYGSFKKIRITILDVYKGSKYDDTCISELFILGYPANEFH